MAEIESASPALSRSLSGIIGFVHMVISFCHPAIMSKIRTDDHFVAERGFCQGDRSP